jgi:hypothetical protein
MIRLIVVSVLAAEGGHLGGIKIRESLNVFVETFADLVNRGFHFVFRIAHTMAPCKT